MRERIRQFVRIAADHLPINEPIYEFGSYLVESQKGLGDLRPFFHGKKFIGADYREGPGVDVVLDLHKIDLPDGVAGTVLCLDTLEHVEYPHRAMEEIFRITADGGVVVISSVMNFRIHDYPYDYWRFTPSAFQSLLKPFTQSFVGWAGEENFPHTVVGVGIKGKTVVLSALEAAYREWQAAQRFELKALAVGMIPPILKPALKRVRDALRH